MIDVARIDYWAASGAGVLHRTTALSKIMFLLLVVAAAVTARSAYPLIIGYAIIFMMVVVTRLPWARMMVLSLYAALFALLYAVTLQGGIPVYALLMFKAITPSFAMLVLVVTTPYPKIFSVLSSVLPEVLTAALFMTYRTLFILLEMMDNFAVSIRLRGGFSPGSLYKNSSNISKGIAMLLVRAVERSSRVYAVMAVRGYSGSMAEKGREHFGHEDLLPLVLGIVILMLAIIWH